MADRYAERLYLHAVERVPANAHLTDSGSAFLRNLIRYGLDHVGAADEDFQTLAEELARIVRRAGEMSTSIDREALEAALSETSFAQPPATRFVEGESDREASESDAELDERPFFRGRGPASDRERGWGSSKESLFSVAEKEAFGVEPPGELHAGDGGSQQSPDEPSPVEASPAGVSNDPPRKAWPRLDAPDFAVEGAPFQVVVGLRKDPDPQITGDALERPADQGGPYFLSIHLVADGFQIEEGESWRRTLAVTAEQPYPTATFTLTPEAEPSPIRAERLVVYFAVEGQTIGQAVRAVAVVQSDALKREAAAPEQPAGRSFTKPGTLEPVDLEVRIVYSEQRHRLLWTFSSRHDLPGIPDEAPVMEIGTNPEAFGQSLIRDIEDVKKANVALNRLKGLGEIVRNHIPEDFWQLLSAATDAARVTRGADRPAVLILSEEPHIPWELAYFEKPLLDENAPPYLNLQVDVGRWALESGDSEVHIVRQRSVDSLAAITGTYDHPRWRDLAEAKTEARTLADLYDAVQVDAEVDRILELCSDNPDLPDVLHFAVHGKYAPGQPGRGLVLLDGDSIHYLTDMDVRGFSLNTGPFVFLNACQVGSGNEMLGNYAGLAHAFLAAGAAAVVAPLWAVHDRLARELALDFYKGVANGMPAVEALREARMHCIASTSDNAKAAVVTTPYAYLYYGHPELLFGWQLAAST